MSQHAIAPYFPGDQNHQSNALSVDEVRQLSQILARLNILGATPSPRFASAAANPGMCGETPGPLAKAKDIFDARQRRARFFPKNILGEGGWDILLVLFIHDGLARLCIKDVAQLISTPVTTVLRWLKVLEEQELITTRKHHHDGRVTILDLTDEGRMRFGAYLEDTMNVTQAS